MARGIITSSLTLFVPIGALTVLAAWRAEAATPTYYNNLVNFQADITSTVTDDYQNPAYVAQQSNAVMNAVLGQTDYMTTGFLNWNLVPGGYYCAGCNGSFELSFQTTTVGTAAGVNGVGMNIPFNDAGTPYYAYITFADGTTANILLPAAGSFWGVAAPERIERIHFGLSMGGTTQAGGFGIDNLIVGDGNIGGCAVAGDCVDDMNPCTDAVCNAGLCSYVPNVAPCDDGNQCTDDLCSGGTCIGQFNANPCDDAEVCTENDVCTLGTCQGTLVDCSDGNECTTDFCSFGVGCASMLNTAPCDDGNLCTDMDVCSGGACGGEPIDCNDDDACTANSCDPERGCVSGMPEADCCDSDDDCPDGYNCVVDTCVGGSSSSGDGEETGTPTDTGTPADTGVDESGGSSGGGSGAIDTGPLDGDTGGSSGAADTGPGLDTGDTGTPGSGCGCTTDPSRDRLWWLLAPLALVLRRRRRAA